MVKSTQCRQHVPAHYEAGPQTASMARPFAIPDFPGHGCHIALSQGATRFLCRGNDIRQALARVFAPVGATTNLGRAANRAGAI